MFATKINRRDFLKITAGVIAGGNLNEALVPKVAVAAESAVKIVRTACRNCTASCGVLAHVRDGRVIKLEGDPDFPRSNGAVCAKGLSGIQALYNPNRNKYPMERVGPRGVNRWKRLTWDEAIDKIAKKLMDVRAKYGAEAVLGSTGGGGNPNFQSIARFCDTFGTPNWFEPGAAQCYMPRMLTHLLGWGLVSGGGGDCSFSDNSGEEFSASANDPSIDPKIKGIAIWGAAPSYSQPAQAGRIVANLRAHDVKTVVIDPRFTPDAAKADVWLPIRPQTDVALGLAWIRYIIENKKYDREFVLRWTNLPALVSPKTKLLLTTEEAGLPAAKDPRSFVVWDTKSKSAKVLEYPYDENIAPALEGTFTVNGASVKPAFQLLKERASEWTLQKAGEVCWLDPKQIEAGIKIYTDNKPSSFGLGVATDQNVNSTQMAMIPFICESLMGNVQKPGVMLQKINSFESYDLYVNPLQHFLPAGQLKKRLGLNEHKGTFMWWTGHTPTILKAMDTGKPYPLKAWIERSGNKLGTAANSQAWRRALNNMELIVHIYMYPTSFSPYADILLPSREWLETDHPLGSGNRLFARQAVTHLFETVNEAHIFARIVKRLGELGHQGAKDAYNPEKTKPADPYYLNYEDQLNSYLRDFNKAKKASGYNIIPTTTTWEDVKKHNGQEYIDKDLWIEYGHYLKKGPDGKPNGFPGPNGTFKMGAYYDAIVKLGRTGFPFSGYLGPQNPVDLPPVEYDPLPYYFEPPESPMNKEVAAKYPLVLTSGRLPMYHHCTLRNIPYLREIQPVAEIWVNPNDAKKYEVSQGDWLWVESLRGRTQARALVTKAIREGVVYMERFWNPETLGTVTNGWQEMNVNMLTKSDPPYNDICGTYTLRGFQVKISKAAGAPKGVWIKPEEFRAWLPEPSNPSANVEFKK
jgi:anaerobic selenocysteine-containing dehydrogenase